MSDHYMKIMGQFPEEFREVILRSPLVAACINSGIQQKMEYETILEQLVLALDKYTTNLEKDYTDYRMNTVNPIKINKEWRWV